MNSTNLYQHYCDQRRAAHQFRSLKDSQVLPGGEVLRDGRKLLNFASNDYLGLSQHPALIAASKDYAARYGAGSAASRLITGNHPLYGQLETKLAKGKGTEAALIFNSGYQANLSVLAALADSDALGQNVTVLADRLSHNSLLQGALLSGTRLQRFQHNDYDHLENLLRGQQDKNSHVIIVTESVFGMDGDCPDLAALITLKNKFGAMLYVDEAHATGVYGVDGFGMAADHKGQIDIVMGTFGKALGSFGAYIACNAVLRDYLLQRCGGMIYSTALPPSVLGSIEAALDLLPQMHDARFYLASQAKRVRQTLMQQGWNIGTSTTHIIPLLLGGEESATSLAQELEHKGILAPAIRPPTVPAASSRLRLSLSAVHDISAIDHLLTILADETRNAA